MIFSKETVFFTVLLLHLYCRMKIGIQTVLGSTGFQATLTDINGKEVEIRLSRDAASELLNPGTQLYVDLPGSRVPVVVRDTAAGPEWIVLNCSAKKVFPAIVIGCQA